MKQENYTLDKSISSKTNSLTNGGGSYENQDFLLLVTSTEDMKLQATNIKGLRYFKKALAQTKEPELFFRNIIHPEDYLEFLQSLNRCCENSGDFDNSEVCIRLKSPFGYWKKFVFKNRIYSGYENSADKYVLSLGKAVDPHAGCKTGPNLEMERSLTESLDRHRVLVNSLDQGYGVVEMIFNLKKEPVDYLFSEVNPAFEKITGLEKPLGKTMREFFQEHESHWFKTFGNVAFKGEAIRFEEYAKAHDTWFDVYAFPIGKKANRKVGFLFSDISARKQSEDHIRRLNEALEYKVQIRTRELKENNDLLQMVFDTVNQGIFLLKPVFGQNSDIIDFIYLRVNKRVKRYYREQEMVGRRFLEMNPGATKDGFFEMYKQTMLTGKSHDFELNFKNDGKVNTFKVTTRRQQGVLVSSLENVTRKRRRAQELKAKTNFKKQLIETSPDIILIFNLYEEKVKFANRGLSAELGLSKEKVEGMPLMDIVPLIHPQDREKAFNFHKSILKASDRDIMEVEFRLRGKDRIWDCYNARAKVFMRNKKGNPFEYIVLLRNVQEQKLTQQALVNAEKLSIKGEIARTLAHELRNPLASIGMSADILEKRIDDSSQKMLHNYINIIKRSSNTLNKLVSNLLNSSNYSPPEFKKCCLASTTDEALDHAEDRIILAGIKVIKNYTGPYYIIADREKLKIALLNIIVNASEAMPPHEGVLELSIKESEGNYILFITDNGCGIEKEHLDNLFDSFYTRKEGGIGIGLSSVRNILEEHAASVEVQSEPSIGTTFILSFPCYRELNTNPE